jgi:hypothetical protein
MVGMASATKAATSVAALKYYLHDGATCFRIQLLGNLSGSHLLELSGCWRTARSSVVGRKLVIDLVRLQNMDDAGRVWLEEMIAEGATIEDKVGPGTTIPARFKAQELQPTAEAGPAGGRKWGRVRVTAVGSV